jgi:hypothetical protein
LIPFVSGFASLFLCWGYIYDEFALKGGIGLITALGMEALKLEAVTDEVWNPIRWFVALLMPVIAMGDSSQK